MPIRFYNEDCSFRLKDKTTLKNWIKEAIEYHNYTQGNISIIFCSNKEILHINKRYLNHNYLTDIITFPFTEESIISADIYIGIEVVKENAKEYNQIFIKELNRVIIHGVLHLLGYDDKTNKDKGEMTDAENYWLNKLSSQK